MYILLKNKFLRREDWSVSPPCHWSLAGVMRLSYAVLAARDTGSDVSRVTCHGCPPRRVLGDPWSHTGLMEVEAPLTRHSGVLGTLYGTREGHCHCVQVNRLSESRSALMLELLMRLESRLEWDRLMVAVSYSPGLPPYTLDPVFSRDRDMVPELERSVPE